MDDYKNVRHDGPSKAKSKPQVAKEACGHLHNNMAKYTQQTQ